MQRITYTQGNTFSVSVPMQKKMVEKVDNVTTITTEDFIPEEGDIIDVRLIGERRQYRYTPTIEGNVAVFVCAGNELAGRYGIEVNVLCANGERMRFADPHAIELVPFTGIMDNFVVGSVELGASVFFAMRGEKGDKGDPGEDGVGISSITKVSTQGLVDTYAITYTDGTSTTFQVTNGAKGEQGAQGIPGVAGADGRGIISITKTASHGLIDTYTITYSDRTTSTYQVTNGANGAAGRGISSIAKTGTSGLVDTYTITYTDGTTTTYQVTNGEDGHDAQEDLMITATKMTGANTYYDLDYTWQELKARLNDDLGGGNMFVQLQLPNNDWIKLPFIVFDTDEMLHFGAEYLDPISGVLIHYDLFYGDDGFAILSATPLVQPLVEVAGATPTQTLTPNTFYKFTGAVTSITLTLGTPITGITNIYAFSFVAGQADPVISLPASVTIDGTPSIAAGDYVEFNIMNNVAIFKVVTI